jgi:predicted transcriptional regulator
MIHAVPRSVYEELKDSGQLDQIQNEIQNEEVEAINKRIAKGHLVEVRGTGKKPSGERDRCYCCGDEVIVIEQQISEGLLLHFRHDSNSECLGHHPANPSGHGQVG